MSAFETVLGPIMRAGPTWLSRRRLPQTDGTLNLIEISTKHCTNRIVTVSTKERAFEGIGDQMLLKPIGQLWQTWYGMIVADGATDSFPNVLLRVQLWCSNREVDRLQTWVRF